MSKIKVELSGEELAQALACTIADELAETKGFLLSDAERNKLADILITAGVVWAMQRKGIPYKDDYYNPRYAAP